MSRNSYTLPPGQPVALSSEQIDKLLAARDGTAALLFLALRRGNGCTVDDAASLLGISRTAAAAAAELLMREGLLARDSESRFPSANVVNASVTNASTANANASAANRSLVNDEIPVYSASDIAREMEKKNDFSALVTETENVLGKPLSPANLQILYGIYDWRGFAPGVIALLVHHCADDCRARYGEDRRPTMRQIDVQAAYWEKQGLFTEELAEQFIKKQADARKLTAQYAAKLQIYGRAPAATELKYLEEWASRGFSPDVVYEAYDITVVKTGKLTWKYCDSILKSWHDQGIHTKDALEQSKNTQRAGAAKKPEPDAMERMLRQMNGGGSQ